MKRIKRIFILFAPFNLFNPFLNTNCQKLPENYPKIILGAGGRRLWVWAKRPQMLNTNCQKLSRCGLDKDASKRHYLNNPTLSDNGAQCGGLGVIAYKGVSETRYLADTPVVASLRDADDMLHS